MRKIISLVYPGLLITIFFVYLILIYPLAYAAGQTDELRPIDLNADGKLEKVSLQYSEPDDYGNCSVTLRVISLGKVYSVRLKEGFNAGTTYLKKLVLSDKIKPFIIVDAKTNKNKNRWIFSFDGRRIKEELVIFSNFPSIEEKDVDRDGVNDIVARIRDDRPGRDPMKDSYERIYKWNGAKFYDSTGDQFKKEPPKAPKPQATDDDIY